VVVDFEHRIIAGRHVLRKRGQLAREPYLAQAELERVRRRLRHGARFGPSLFRYGRTLLLLLLLQLRRRGSGCGFLRARRRCRSLRIAATSVVIAHAPT